jgi:transposase-like protein
MVTITLKCPFYGSEDVRPYGTSNGKSGMRVIISSCSHKTLYAEYRYNGCKPDVKKAIIKRAADGVGVRATARALGQAPIP